MLSSILSVVLALVLAPLLLGVVNRTKAIYAGRKGQPLLQLYYDLYRLLRKGAVYSRTTSWIFRAGPIVGLAATALAIPLIPFGGGRGLFSFAGDFFFAVYLLGVVRFLWVIAALDTGSSFEGMGGSREVAFSALAEPALLLALTAVAWMTRSLSLSDMVGRLSWTLGPGVAPIAMVGCTLFVVFLAENARIPVDDPNTHLELTMIHEVMVLDHSGPDFAMIQYTAALKFWLLGAILIGVLLPFETLPTTVRWPVALGGMFTLAILVGIVESTMARLRLLKVPQLLGGACALAIFALILVVR
ncbi:MAG: hydrogenase [Phycisphaerae bacterium]|nr:hydrogenase [Phycisphaerae bacterium]